MIEQSSSIKTSKKSLLPPKSNPLLSKNEQAMRNFNFKPQVVDELDKNRMAAQIFDLDSDRPGLQKSKRTEIREVIT